MSERVAIVGAGLVGSLWAVLLRKRGFAVDLYEKRPDMRGKEWLGDRSINLVITSRGLHGLKTAGLLEKATALSVSVYGRMIHGRDGSTTYQPYGQENEFNLSISRSALNRFLLDAAESSGAKLHFSYELQEIDFANRVLRFTNGEQAGYTRLFGTDGAGSLVRKDLIRYSPQAYQDRIEWLEADYLELTLPVGKDGKPRIKQNALHIWPRGSHMMMALANQDGSFTVTLYMPRTGEMSFEKFVSAEDADRLFKSEFPDAIPLMPDFAKEFASHPRGKLGTVRCSNWVYGDSVALMGDAAHAIVPFFGQGMNCGFEDCTNLLKIMDRTQNWSEILNQYNDDQRPNGNAIADMAVENWYEMRDKVADPRFLLRKKVEALLEKNFPDIFKSRYGLVAYTLVPYSVAQQAGRLQDKLLERLCEGIHSPEEIHLPTAEALLRAEYLPFWDPMRQKSTPQTSG